MSEVAADNGWKASVGEKVVTLGSHKLKDLIDGTNSQYDFVYRIQAFIETTSNYVDKTRGVTMFEDFLSDGSVSIDLDKYTLMK